MFQPDGDVMYDLQKSVSLENILGSKDMVLWIINKCVNACKEISNTSYTRGCYDMVTNTQDTYVEGPHQLCISYVIPEQTKQDWHQ